MSNQHPLVPLAVGGVGFMLKYMAYNFLTPVVLLTFAVLVVAQIALVGPEIPFYEYFSALLPDRLEAENIHIDETDIMTVYNLVTLVIFVLSITGKWLIRLLVRAYKRVFQPEFDVQPGADNAPASPSLVARLVRRLLINSLVITAVHGFAFIAVPVLPMSDGSGPASTLLVFGVFYVIAMIANAIYVVIDSFSDSVIGWAMAHRYQ